jgi:hypothetical protein
MVAERVDDLAGRTQCHLEDKWRKACAQFIGFEESTDVEATVQPAVSMWGVDEVFQLVQVLLSLVPTKGKHVLVFFLSFGSTLQLSRAAVGEKYLCLLVMWLWLRLAEFMALQQN